jgi:hypothetical protein
LVVSHVRRSEPWAAALSEKYVWNGKVLAMPITPGDKVSVRFFDTGLIAKELVAIFFASYATAVPARTIRIKLADGKTG